MKPLYQCDYCDKIGTEEVIAQHELNCICNYNRKSCFTCKNAGPLGTTNIGCRAGKVIEKGRVYENCDLWVWDEKNHTTDNLVGTNSLFGGFFL